MSDINSVTITGNLTRDPELRATASGSQVMNLRVACNESRKQQDGSWRDEPHYFDAVMFGTRASAIANFLEKGMRVEICGRLSYSQWTDSTTGQSRSKVEIRINDIHWTNRTNAPSQTARDAAAATGGTVTEHDDIPF